MAVFGLNLDFQWLAGRPERWHTRHTSKKPCTQPTGRTGKFRSWQYTHGRRLLSTTHNNWQVSNPCKICIWLNCDVFNCILGELEELEEISGKAKAWMDYHRHVLEQQKIVEVWLGRSTGIKYNLEEAYQGIFATWFVDFCINLYLTRFLSPGHANI